MSRLVLAILVGLLLTASTPGFGNEKFPEIDVTNPRGVAEWLLKQAREKGEDLDAWLADTGRSTLHWAAINGSVEQIEVWIEAGAKVDVRSKTGWTPLHYAAYHGHREVVKVLIEAGADAFARMPEIDAFPIELALHQRDKKKDSPHPYNDIIIMLDAAIANEGQWYPKYMREDLKNRPEAVRKHVEMRMIELAKEARKVVYQNLPKWRKEMGTTGLQFVAQARNKGAHTMVQRLLIAGENPNARDEDKRTALHYAARGEHPSIIMTLVDAGALVNAKDAVGMTPLHYAAMHGKPEAVSTLINLGADPLAQSRGRSRKSGFTPLQAAYIGKDKTEGDTQPFYAVIKILTTITQGINRKVRPQQRRPTQRRRSQGYGVRPAAP